MTEFRNLLPQIAPGGVVVEDLSVFSDDDLRLGLMQLIDNMERLDIMASLPSDVTTAWRDKNLERFVPEWRRSLADLAQVEPEGAPTGSQPWDGYQVYSPTNRFKVENISNLDRPRLERNIRQTCEFINMVGQAAQMTLEAAHKCQSGTWFRGDGVAQEPEAVQPLKSRPGSVRR